MPGLPAKRDAVGAHGVAWPFREHGIGSCGGESASQPNTSIALRMLQRRTALA